ncbi:M23 family metallopeptidase [Phaeocystidibacter marisrubri]|uniref:Peptidoglycan DD-metalloendopeptidase family protein n=1 Tax=Phaeocystidibacter marisrubri TaxID=1577780 RepID=A0A6L3ZFZ5_9FLAO|nr:M23 family metallopeptidase [Phaeocystidibacter marisrubri]KAB2816966.1 peptidoglycan DD-metalloendopeptidase family protein [Phaeocystidibacter marisrubri]GGH77407.1 peptidase [Phaeocystidibacter marisrubri]
MKKTLTLLSLALSLTGFSQYREFAELAPATLEEEPLTPSFDYFLEELSVFQWEWDNHECHVDSIDLSLSEDTIHLNWVDRRHGSFQLPMNGQLRSKFGWRGSRYHYGVDLKLSTGDTIYAAFDGKIRYAQYNRGGYGNLVVIRHYNGVETYYAHLSKFLVDTNQYVRSGQAIGLGGSTGRSTGPHLHFEVRYLGNAINPEEVINFETGELISKEMDITSDVFSYKKEMRARRYHRVRSGETLSALARRYHTSVSSICRLNGISRNSIIRIGQNLRVR